MSDHVVGRVVERAEIRTAVRSVRDGRSAVVAVCGEPGIGKTTLARAVMDEARRSGMAVGWGTAPEAGGCPPYWPLQQAVCALDGDCDSTGGLTALPMVSGSNSGDRWELFQAVADRVRRAAEGAPPGLLMVLDDLHWADRATLRLLEHLITQVIDDPVAFLLLYRDTERTGNDALRDVLVAAARHPRVLRQRLTGLTHDEISQVLTESAGAAPDADRLSTVSRRSRGNPFFVAELGRLAVTDDEVPSGVRDLVLKRLDVLQAPVRELVRAAAALAPEFEPGLLAAAAGVTLDEALTALDRGTEAGLLQGKRQGC